jgi:magnesium-transporting ATPase (P-type)
MDKKYILSVIIIFVVSTLLGMVIHGMVLSDEYQATGLFRPVEEQSGYLVCMLLAHLIFSGAFVWLYRAGLEVKPWVGQGVRFGGVVTLLAAVPLYMIYYAVQPMPEMLVFRQATYEAVNLIILGLVVAFMYR